MSDEANATHSKNAGPSSQVRHCPALGASFPDSAQIYFPTTRLPVYIRPLTRDEIDQVNRFAPQVSEARDHFLLFRIFGSNYLELVNHIRRSVMIGEADDKERVEFDRLLLNMLAAGRAITDHFRCYFVARFRNTKQEDDLKQYLARMRKGSWRFALAEDVRDFGQLQGLPVVDYNRSFTGTSAHLSITLNAERLSERFPRAWKNSRLNASHGTVDFFEVIREYYRRVTGDLAKWLAKRLVPDLLEAHYFFASLAAETQQSAPGATMVVLSEFISVGDESMGTKHNYGFLFYPEDVFAELGITLQTKGDGFCATQSATRSI